MPVNKKQPIRALDTGEDTMNNIVNFRNRNQETLESLFQEGDERQQDFESILAQKELKLNNGKGLTEKDADDILRAMARLEANSQSTESLMHNMGLLSDDDKCFEELAEEAWDELEEENSIRRVK